MRRIFCDSTFLVAFRHVRDDYHQRARQVVDSEVLKFHPLISFVITDYIFDETVTVLKKKAGNTIAIEMAKYLNGSDFKLEYVKEELFNEAFTVFTRYKDKKWSFTDCTSYVWIRQFKPDGFLATDEDFNQFGLAVPNLMMEAS